MRKYIFLLLIAYSFCGAGFGQSGRKTGDAPTTPTEIEKAADYSESTPRRSRATASAPDYPSADRSSAINPPLETANQQKSAANAEGDIVRVETNLVSIPVSVLDRNGLYVSNLGQADFKIFEDGAEQEIAYFGTSEKPFTVVLLLDTSPSTEYKIEEIQAAATAFVDQLKAQDKVMVIEFDANVNVLTEATSDRRKIYKAIKKADFGGGTSLYDAVDFSLGKRLSKIAGRKAIVLFTDGVDTTSGKADYGSTVRRAEEADALIFPIYYNTFSDYRASIPSAEPDSAIDLAIRGTTAKEYALGRKYLEDLADYTGGRIFRPEAAPGALSAAFEGIAEELRRQYNIGYYPNGAAQAGQRKTIKVRVNRPNLVVRARDSYIVGGEVKSAAPVKIK